MSNGDHQGRRQPGHGGLQALELIDGKIAFYDEWLGTGQSPQVLPNGQTSPVPLAAPAGTPKRRRAGKG